MDASAFLSVRKAGRAGSLSIAYDAGPHAGEAFRIELGDLGGRALASIPLANKAGVTTVTLRLDLRPGLYIGRLVTRHDGRERTLAIPVMLE